MLGWRDFGRMTNREITVQAAVILLVVLIIWGAVRSAQINLEAMGLTSGFGFLERGTGWGYSFSLLERTIDDSYARTIMIGFSNTLFVGFISIIFATIFGFIIGTMRDSRNLGLQMGSALYVQVFRNIPLILQVAFLYSILIHFPGPKQAMSIGEMVFMSNRGIMVPSINLPLAVGLICLAAMIVLAIAAFKLIASRLAAIGLWLLGVILIWAVAGMLYTPPEQSFISMPELKGLRFRGGLTLSVELVAMIVGIVLYGAAYVAEIVRGGLAEVPKGLTEAGESLGLGKLAIWSTIKMPMALRSIVPPLGNQWIFLMKATTVGIAVGFSDLFYIVSTSITQSGQTLELITIMMGLFLAINFVIAKLVNLLNARIALKGYG